MSLYQKHRPDTFEEIVGNEGVVSNLQGLLASDDPPHAFLLIGGTGCGKTTLARIIAKELGVSEQDFEEKDTADFRGIDTARQIRHNAHYKALAGERRAWLIDECHKLTNDAQNALLKGLEDPPEHCFYILATTEPEKLLPTIKSRCSIHVVKPLTVPEMIKLLVKVCAKEKKPLSRKVLDAIARRASISLVDSDDRADCHPRFALQILEKVLVSSAEEQLKVVEDSEGIVNGADNLSTLMLKKKGWKEVAICLAAIDDDNVEQIRRGVLNYCKKALWNSSSNDIAAEVIEQFSTPFFESGVAGLTLACYKVVVHGP